MKPRPNIPPNGQIRASQVVTTYGPGSLVDLPKRSVIVGGLDQWENVTEEVHEPRLVEKLKSVLKLDQLRLFKPPAADDGPQGRRSGITAWQFPEWFITQDVLTYQPDGTRTRRLLHRRALENEKDYWRDDDKKRHAVVPIRFVRGCPRGHIGDIDWIWFVHSRHTKCTAVELFIDEKGTTGDISEISVRCRCGASMPLSIAASHKTRALGKCDGRRPWLGPFNNFNCEDCKEPNRLMVRNASNAYFPETMSVISLPDRDDSLDKAITLVWDFVEAVEGPEDVKRERKKARVRDALDGFTDEQVYKAIDSRRTGGSDAPKSVKQAEFEVLSSVTKEVVSDTLDQKFTARILPQSKWVTAETPKSLADAIYAKVERIVLVDRLRDVVAQVGFTRFESVSADTEGELDLNPKRAALAREITWLPAIENKGEGFFVQFQKSAIDEWLIKLGVESRVNRLGQGFGVWKSEHPESGREFPNRAFMLMHTLSHLLMTALSLECGYPSSSLRERVYALDAGYGILIYTGTSDTEGTLGGLIEAGKQVARHLETALRMGGLCSNDPVCAQHDPVSTHEGRHLHGAACHGCVLIAETSCEQHNDYLDRALVVPTVEQQECEFFATDAV